MSKQSSDSEGQSSGTSGTYLPEWMSDLEIEPEKKERVVSGIRSHDRGFQEDEFDGSKSVKKSENEKQTDKKGAKEKALREKTQIEFFERGTLANVPELID